MSGYRVAGRYYAALGAAILAAQCAGVAVYRGHQLVWTP